jgi:hypothetical protein
VRLSHRVHTPATTAQVWDLLSVPAAWPQFLLLVRRVRGTDGPAVTGQRLLGVTRFASVGIPVDVLEAVHERRLSLLVHTAPGLRERVTYYVTPALRGGCDVEVSVSVEGPFAISATVPVFLTTAFSTRLLAALAAREARTAQGAA